MEQPAWLMDGMRTIHAVVVQHEESERRKAERKRPKGARR